MTILDPATRARIAKRAMAGIGRVYPNKPSWVLTDASEVATPDVRTPAFCGCFDWHSAVHAHWSLARLLSIDPDAEWAPAARARLQDSLRDSQLRAELSWRRAQPGFEMPYGVAWLLALHAELAAPGESAQLARALAPLAEQAAIDFHAWLDRLPCPIRSGEHSQSAFAMILALEAARRLGQDERARHLEDRARSFYLSDREAPLAYEPSAYDFLSPSLSEAALLAMVLDADAFAEWLLAFLPEALLEPVRTVDRSEGKLVHWDGLNLSRAWMLDTIAAALPGDAPGRARLAACARQHLLRGLDGLVSEDYAGAHWLGTFALLALGPAPRNEERATPH